MPDKQNPTHANIGDRNPAAPTVECHTLKALFRESPAAMAVWQGPGHVFELVNPEYQAIFEGRELVGKTFVEALPELAHQAFPALLTKVLETGEPYVGREVLARLAPGTGGPLEDRYYDFTYRRITDSTGKPYGVCVHAVDVTDRVLARRGLEQSEEHLRLALRGARMGMWSILLSENRIISDETFREIHGVTEDEGVQEAINRRVHPDDRERVRAELQAAMRNGTAYACEYRLLNADGSVRWVYARGEPKYDETNTPLSISGITFDIDDRKRAEEQAALATHEREARFRQLADAVPQMVWVTGPDGFHEFYNRRWYEFTGVPEGSTDGEGWSEMFHPDDRQEAWARWRRSLATGEPYDVEYRLRHHSGEYRWTLGRALPIRNQHGEIERWFGTCTDIDAMKRLTAEREALLDSERRARAEAERASRVKDEFLATLSHELRTPLSAILGWTQVMRRGELTREDLSRGLETIERNARVQTRLIEDLLDMSRIISGKLHLDIQPVQPVLLIDAAIETVMPAASAKGIRIEKFLDPHAGSISGDANRLQQVVWNLLSNAIKFTPAAGRVRISLQRVNQHLELSVADTGQGIAADFLPRVFDRFLQADSTTTRRYGGLGLGLAIVRQLVELHGGTVSVMSGGENQGTTFTVRLPLAVDSTHRHGSRPPERRASGGTRADWRSPRLDGVKVLVVDDEPDAREFLKRMLEDGDAHVVTAASAADGLKAIEAQRPDVLVSDIGMAEVDGYEFLRRVRALDAAQGGKTPAVALTAFARSEDRTKALLAGYVAHIVKPADPAELMATIAAVAGRTGE